MKFPALVLAASFASGILAGQSLLADFPHSPRLLVPTAALLIIFALLICLRGFIWLACVITILSWSVLGMAAFKLQSISIPPRRIDNLLAQRQLKLDQPLRWRGILRADPLLLPWGIRYIADLSEVQSQGQWIPVTGGIRTDYYLDEFNEGRSAPAPPNDFELRAGDSVEFLARAREVRNFGDPGAFDYRTFLARQNIYVTATLRNFTLMEKLPGSNPPAFTHLVPRLRGNLLRRMDATFGSADEKAAVLRAMLLGDRSFLDSEQVETFQKTGAYHILVLSGLQVGVLAAMLLWLIRRLRLPLVVGVGVSLFALWAYAGIVEDHPPILRAVLMATFFLLAYALFRHTHVLNAIGLAALCILSLQTSEIYDASFQLSFVAVLAIGGIAAPWLERTAGIYLQALDQVSDTTRDGRHPPQAAQFRLDLRSLQVWLATRLPLVSRFAGSGLVTLPVRVGLSFWETVVVSAVIQLAMVPLMAQYFHRVTILGLAANVPAVLLTALIVPLGFLSFGITAVWRAAGELIIAALNLSLEALLWSMHYIARVSWGSFRVPSPPAAVLLVFFALAIILFSLVLAGLKWPARISATVLVILVFLIARHPFAPQFIPGKLEVSVLDVGQGDAIFIAFPNGTTMLVDGGGLPGAAYIRSRRPGIDVGEDVVSPYLWSRGLKRLDVIALTHGHQDHLAGLKTVLQNFKVGELWIGRDIDAGSFQSLIQEARVLGVRVVHHQRGEQINFGGVSTNVLWPDNLSARKTAQNDDSLVLQLRDGNETILLTGDIERPVERQLTSSGDLLQADFVKVPHHGSRTSSTESFLQAVQPRFAAVSVGENNPFGHPNGDVLERVQMQGARLFRTDRDGAITVITDGNELQVSTFSGR